MNRTPVFIGSAVALVLVLVVGTLVLTSRDERPAPAVESRQATLVRFHAPTQGNPDAKVHIVEFLDPACEACRAFYPYVKRIMAANPGRIRLSVRHVPFHKGSDQVVKLLEATRKQGKYWQALEALLASQPRWVVNHVAQPELAWQAFEGLGLDLEQLRQDANAAEIAQRVEQDLNDAKALKVTKTPEYFVNGRPLPSFGLEQLQRLVSEELESAY